MVLDSWYRPSGISIGWLNLKHMLLLSFVTFKFIDWTRDWLPFWNISSYLFVLAFSYWFGFVVYRWLKRTYLAFTIASYKKAILITGCDSGLGNMLARKLAKRGFQVLASCLDAESPDAIKLRSIPKVSVFGLDVTKQESLDHAFSRVDSILRETQTDLWAVVCNAGLCEIGEVEWIDLKKMQQMLDVNVMGSVRTVKTFIPILRRSKGRVVLTSSVFGNAACPGFVGYSLTQAAITSLGEGLKRELQQWDVDVCTVQPALYDTGLFRVAEKKSAFMKDELVDLPEQLREEYGHEYFVGFWNSMSRFVTDNANPHTEEAVSKLFRAVTTVWPETHYRVGSWRQILFYNLLDYMPTEFADLCFEFLLGDRIQPDAVVAPCN